MRSAVQQQPRPSREPWHRGTRCTCGIESAMRDFRSVARFPGPVCYQCRASSRRGVDDEPDAEPVVGRVLDDPTSTPHSNCDDYQIPQSRRKPTTHSSPRPYSAIEPLAFSTIQLCSAQTVCQAPLGSARSGHRLTPRMTPGPSAARLRQERRRQPISQCEPYLACGGAMIEEPQRLQHSQQLA